MPSLITSRDAQAWMTQAGERLGDRLQWVDVPPPPPSRSLLDRV